MPKVALFQLCGGKHALPLAGVERILPLPPVFPLPLLPEPFAGVFIHQGRPIPVLAPDSLGGAAVSQPAALPAYVIVCTTEFGPVGLPADRMPRIVEQGAGHRVAAEHLGGAIDIFQFQGERYPFWRPETLIA
jgi:chemotaxis signal transduction protein